MVDMVIFKVCKVLVKWCVKVLLFLFVWKNVGGMVVVIFLLDQVLKYVVVYVLDLDCVCEIDVLDLWLNLCMVWNQGMNFGLFVSDVDIMCWVLIVIVFVVCLWVVIWVGCVKFCCFVQFLVGMLIGGVLGNVVDCFLYGVVVDFLNMLLLGWQNLFSFNVVDIVIFLGVIGLVLMLFEKKFEFKKCCVLVKLCVLKFVVMVVVVMLGLDYDVEQVEFLLEDFVFLIRCDGNGKIS